VQLAAVGSGGELSFTVTYIKNEKPVHISTMTARGVLIRGIDGNQTEKERQDWDGYQAVLKGTIENKMPSSTGFTSKINQGLNG